MADLPAPPTDELSPAQRFGALIERFAGQPGVTTPDEVGRHGFGSAALKVNGSIFAMLIRHHLVVKLPRARVCALIDAETGGPFDAGKGTPMKEWLTVTGGDDRTWHTLAEEACVFVRTGS